MPSLLVFQRKVWVTGSIFSVVSFNSKTDILLHFLIVMVITLPVSILSIFCGCISEYNFLILVSLKLASVFFFIPVGTKFFGCFILCLSSCYKSYSHHVVTLLVMWRLLLLRPSQLNLLEQENQNVSASHSLFAICCRCWQFYVVRLTKFLFVYMNTTFLWNTRGDWFILFYLKESTRSSKFRRDYQRE